MLKRLVSARLSTVGKVGLAVVAMATASTITLAPGLTHALGTPCSTTCYVNAASGDDAFGGDTTATAKKTIQAALDAVDAGGQVRVMPGNYHEAAPNSVPTTIGGTYQFGLFFGAGKPGISLIGVTALDVAITNATATLTTITTNATNSFGTDGIFVEAANTTIQGVKIGPNDSGDNKTIEVVGDNFTLRSAATAIPNGGGSIYIDDFSAGGTVVQSYHILNNSFPDGTSVDIASGAGNTGPLAGREILGNTFDLGDNGFNAISFNGSGGVPWFVNPVGGAIIHNNSFANSIQFIRARGTYAESEFDWVSYWNDNTFDKAAVALVTSSPFVVRANIAGAFTNIRRIGGTIQGEVDNAAAGDTVLAKAGTYDEAVSISRPVTVQGAGAGNTVLQGAHTGNGIGIASGTDDVSISGLTVSGFDNGVALVPGGGAHDNLTFQNMETIANDVHGLFLPGASLDNVSLTNVNSSDNGLAGSSGRGVYFTDGTKTNISITGGTFDRNALVGIDLNDGSASGIAITGNQVVGNGDSGIGVLGAQGPGANLIAGNTVTNNGRFGIEIKVPTGNGAASGPGSVVVSGNTVTRTVAATDARDYAGIAVFRRAGGPLNADQPSGVVVSGNTVSGYHRKPTGSTGDGFGIVVEGLGQVVRGNVVSQNDVDIQIQASNSPDVQNTPFFDRGSASVSSATINGNTILSSTNFDLRNVGAPTTDATCNAYDSATGPAAGKVFGGFIIVPVYPTPNTAVPCGVPTGATATAGDSQAVVSWNAPAADGGSALTGYIVTASPGGATCSTTGALTCTVAGLVNGTTYTFTVQATNASGRGPSSGPSSPVTPFVVASAGPVGDPDFNPVAPQRVFDTRPGQSPNALRTVTKAKVGGAIELEVQMTNLSGFVPLLGVGAVSLNITVTNPDAAGFVTAYPCGVRELVASVNYLGGQTVSNAAIVPVSATGTVCFFSNVPTDIVVDINGWLTAGRGFSAIAPKRIFDTRPGQSPDALRTVQTTPVPGGTFLAVRVVAAGGVPATGVSAVSLNLGVTNPSLGGFITVYPCGSRELVSNVNYTIGETVSNAVIASVSTDGMVCFFTSATTDLVVDINGWFAVGSDFNGVTPTRVFDTRAGQSPDAVRTVPKAKIGGATTLEVQMTNLAGRVPATGVSAVSLNIAVTNPDAAGFVTVYPCGTLNLVASINYAPGQTVSNAVLVPVSATGTVCFFSNVPTDIVVDLNGWFSTQTPA
jgi:Fibronectin type III domain